MLCTTYTESLLHIYQYFEILYPRLYHATKMSTETGLHKRRLFQKLDVVHNIVMNFIYFFMRHSNIRSSFQKKIASLEDNIHHTV